MGPGRGEGDGTTGRLHSLAQRDPNVVTKLCKCCVDPLITAHPGIAEVGTRPPAAPHRSGQSLPMVFRLPKTTVRVKNGFSLA